MAAMTEDRARRVFGLLMRTAQTRPLSPSEKTQLTYARQRLRALRKGTRRNPLPTHIRHPRRSASKKSNYWLVARPELDYWYTGKSSGWSKDWTQGFRFPSEEHAREIARSYHPAVVYAVTPKQNPRDIPPGPYQVFAFKPGQGSVFVGSRRSLRAAREVGRQEGLSTGYDIYVGDKAVYSHRGPYYKDVSVMHAHGKPRGNPESDLCPTCGKPADRPYRVRDERGHVTAGCVDAFHGKPDMWARRKEAGQLRAATKGFKSTLRKLRGNPAGLVRMGKLVEIRYNRDHGTQPGFYKHTFKVRPTLYYDPDRNDIIAKGGR